MGLEEEILDEISNKWKEYSKNFPDNVTTEIAAEYVNMLLFFDSLFPNVESDEISHRNIIKTIIITHMKNEVVNEVKGSEYEEIVAEMYNSKKK